MLSAKTLFPIVVVTATATVPCRPADFHQQYIAAKPTPYQFVDSSPQQPFPSGGVLVCGQAIWLENPVRRTQLTASVRAFVENVGFVSLDPRLIRKGDGSVLLPFDRVA